MDADFIMTQREEELILLLGSNMGDKEAHMSMAINLLQEQLGNAESISSIHHTPPWGNTDQDDFVNQAILIPCRIKPLIVLEIILEIEQKIGRIRYEKWGPRCIDIDIIFYGALMYQSDLLEIPHPYMEDRLFVLEPLQEIAPDFRHPRLNFTVAQLLEQLKSKQDYE